MSAKILSFPKAHEAAERSVDADITELKAVLKESVELALELGTDEPAAAAARPEEMEPSGESAPFFADCEIDGQEREFVLAQCHTDTERAYLKQSLANLLAKCHCRVCEAGGNCCGGPFGWTIGELLAAAYDEDLPVTSISPKNRKLILKAASELAAKLTDLKAGRPWARPEQDYSLNTGD